MKLSILICSVDNRLNELNLLMPTLCREDVEVLWLGDNRKMTIGEKRNWLLSMAKGEYVVFVDDDDRLEPDYVDELLLGCIHDSDVICFNVMYSPINGEPMPVYYSSRYVDENKDGFFLRAPNHLMCFKRELALRIMFIETNFGEDNDFAARIKPLIKSEWQINKVLYHYLYSFENSESERRQRNG